MNLEEILAHINHNFQLHNKNVEELTKASICQSQIIRMLQNEILEVKKELEQLRTEMKGGQPSSNMFQPPNEQTTGFGFFNPPPVAPTAPPENETTAPASAPSPNNAFCTNQFTSPFKTGNSQPSSPFTTGNSQPSSPFMTKNTFNAPHLNSPFKTGIAKNVFATSQFFNTK
jgi:hypothetical protein